MKVFSKFVEDAMQLPLQHQPAATQAAAHPIHKMAVPRWRRPKQDRERGPSPSFHAKDKKL